MSNNQNIQTSINNSLNSSTEGFFRKIYTFFYNLIKKNPQENNRDISKKLNDSFDHYVNHYKKEIDYYVKEPYKSKTGLINLLNDCYMVAFLQILFHTPHFFDILQKYNKKNEKETLISYLIKVAEYPFNAEYFFKLKQSLGLINPDYAKPWPNDSQEFGIDLINYLISETKGEIYENEIELNLSKEIDFITVKKIVYENYISAYQNQINDLEKLFLFNEIDVFLGEKFKKPRISSNLHLDLSLQKYQDYVEVEKLIQNKYKNSNIKQIQNQMVIIKKFVSLPEILIITIYRALTNEKINFTRLLFTDTLDLKNYIDFDLFNDENKKTTYQLYAINECIKTSRESHNRCYIKIENRWFIFDDDRKVEEFKGSFKDSPFIVGLFYKRDN